MPDWVLSSRLRSHLDSGYLGGARGCAQWNIIRNLAPSCYDWGTSVNALQPKFRHLESFRVVNKFRPLIGCEAAEVGFIWITFFEVGTQIPSKSY